MHVLVAMFVAICVQATLEDIFTSMQHIDVLFYEEYTLLVIMHHHIVNLQAKIKLLHEKLTSLSKPITETPTQFIENPVSAFQLIRRLTRDWPLVIHLMTDKYDLPKETPKLPTEQFLLSALRGLSRLQEVYNLSIQDLSEGWLRGKQGSSILKADDIFELAKYCYYNQKYDEARTWLMLKQLHFPDKDQSSKALSYLYLALGFTGCKSPRSMFENSALLTQLLTEDPAYTPDPDIAYDFKLALSSKCPAISLPSYQQDDLNETESELFNSMCRGERQTQQSLKCYYIHYNNPALLVAPFKLEELFIDPPVVMVHQAISDKEIEEMKSAFQPVMEDCKITQQRSAVISPFRTCMMAWVDKASASVSRRMEHFTNLSTADSENTLVACYGVGGEFKMHYDAFDNFPYSQNKSGNRLATILVYMNDVAMGGHTVFPYLNISLSPQKGSAVFWYNIHPDGRPDGRVRHGGCPVLMGSKWVITKWIREGGQSINYNCQTNRSFSRRYFYK